MLNPNMKTSMKRPRFHAACVSLLYCVSDSICVLPVPAFGHVGVT
jgi:hypothetical protein